MPDQSVPTPEGRDIQVDASWYGRRYMDQERIITHWHQAVRTAERCPEGGRVLEVGPGNGHVTWLLRSWGLQVDTLDFDPELKPDIVGDVTCLPLADKAYDCVLAAEVLEHLPWKEFNTALAELRRVCRGHVVLTLPAPFLGLSLMGNMTWVDTIALHLGLPHWKRHRFDGQHYWEVGKRGTERRVVRKAILQAGFQIEHEYRPAPSRYCLFFLLKA